MHNNRYTFIYAIVLSILTAIVLVYTSESLKPQQEANIALDTKSNILKSVLITSTNKSEIEQIYKEKIQELVVNSEGKVLEGVNVQSIDMKNEVNKEENQRKLPLYIFTNDKSEKYYIIPLRGVGLWGPIWGFISIKSDFNTVYGAFFDHKSETPGLGAEISEGAFQSQFQGKQILDDKNAFASVNVIKASAKSEFQTENRVDAISGGTITSNGTNDMLKNGIGSYLNYFEKLKTK